jgi:hypothetical protein
MEAMFLRNVGLPPSYTALQPRDRILINYRCANLKSTYYLLPVIGLCDLWCTMLHVAIRFTTLFVCVIKSTVVSFHWNITSNFSHRPSLALPGDYYTHCELSNFTSVSRRSFRHNNRQPAILIPHEAHSNSCAGSYIKLYTYFLSTSESVRGRA